MVLIFLMRAENESFKKSGATSSEGSFDDGEVTRSSVIFSSSDQVDSVSRTVKTSCATSQNRKTSEEEESDKLSSFLRDLSGPDYMENQSARSEPRLGVQSDGTVILPRISYRVGRLLICLLGIFLSALNAKRYAVTFLSWEVAFYFINGLPPMPPPNMVMILAAVMGLRESQLNTAKKLVHIVNCVILDFSLFLSSVLLPHIVTNIIKSIK